jgi:ACS family pantothenate transporter-like MFS transporter
MAKLGDQEVQVQQQAVEVIDAEPKRKWQSYIWDSLGKSPEERHFLFKLDSAVLTFASLGQYYKSSHSLENEI